MEWRHAVPGDRRPMLGRRVTDVRRELPGWVQRVGTAHEAIAGDLGDDRRCRDRGARGIPVDDRPLLVAKVGHGEPVDQAQAALAGNSCERVAERPEIGHVQTAAVDAAHRARDNRDGVGTREHARVELLARRVVVLLGVVERRQ
jgi:hypothetical protein